MIPIQINLGGGKIKKDGFINIDKVAHLSDVGSVDLETDKIPFEDELVDEIYSHHCIEHLRDVQNVLNEAWRVLKKGGIFEITVPYGLWEGASKPVHKQLITECWFDFLRQSDIYEIYGYRSWDIVEMKIETNKQGVKYEITCKLTPRK